MSTSTVTPSSNVPPVVNGGVVKPREATEWWEIEKSVTTDEHLSQELYTLVVGYTKEESAKENAKAGEGKLSVKPEGEDTEELIAKGEFVELFRQTFRQYFPNDLDGANKLIPDDEEKINLIFASLKVKQANRARALVLTKAFTPQNFTIDLFEQAGQKSERRLTAQEKIEKAIFEDFSPEMQKALLAKLMAMQGK